MTDLVYVVRPGNRNDELLYSLRSAAANLTYDRVWIVGHRPAWLTGVEHLPTRQDDHKHINTLNNLRAAAACDDICDEFVLMNDDMFVLQPTPVAPQLHRGTIDSYIQRRRRAGGGYGSYTARAVETRELLVRLGRDPAELLSYELHTPMPVRRQLLREALDHIASITRTSIWCYSKRTFYGNYARVGGELAEDCKISDDQQWHHRGGAGAVQTWRYVSTADASFKYGHVGRWLRARFPIPSPYERLPGHDRRRLADLNHG